MEKIIDNAAQFLSGTSEIILNRFKNPYVTTFSISWVVFNWKALSIFIFSKGNIEYKISQITKHHSDILHTFIYPFVFSIVFLFLIPYLNQANEWFISKSVKNRAEFKKIEAIDKIKIDKDLAIAIDEKETAIKNARESTEHNKYIDELKSNIDELSKILNDERKRFSDNIKISQDEKAALTKEISDIQTKLNKEADVLLNKARDTEQQLNKILRQKQDLDKDNQNLTEENIHLNSIVNSLQNSLNELNLAIDIQTKLRLEENKNSNATLITFSDGEKVLEIFSDSGYPRYINYPEMTEVEINVLRSKMNSMSFDKSATHLSNSEKASILSKAHNNLNKNRNL